MSADRYSDLLKVRCRPELTHLEDEAEDAEDCYRPDLPGAVQAGVAVSGREALFRSPQMMRPNHARQIFC